MVRWAGRHIGRTHPRHGGTVNVHSGDDLSTVGLRQQRLEEGVRIRQALLLDDCFISDDAVAPVEVAIVLLA